MAHSAHNTNYPFQCRPEYKIPGLYVIDSIVRQSRHQFGAEKDVFAPRFSKNITYTFYYIYQCTAEEKVILCLTIIDSNSKSILIFQSKVIRVLNLWQKNAVFPPEVIQPLFDMADVSHPKYKEVSQFINSRGQSSSSITASKGSQDTSASVNGSKDPPISFEDASNEGSQVKLSTTIVVNYRLNKASLCRVNHLSWETCPA